MCEAETDRRMDHLFSVLWLHRFGRSGEAGSRNTQGAVVYPSLSPGQRHMLGTLRRVLLREYAREPETERELFEERYFVGRTYRQIAERPGSWLPEEQVKERVRGTRRRVLDRAEAYLAADHPHVARYLKQLLDGRAS